MNDWPFQEMSGVFVLSYTIQSANTCIICSKTYFQFSMLYFPNILSGKYKFEAWKENPEMIPKHPMYFEVLLNLYHI